MTPLKTIPFITAFLVMLAGPIQAACFADYRATMDNPLRLHYGVIELDDTVCSIEAATPEISSRIAVDGWQLLQVISVFDETGLAARMGDAGDYYLRY